MNKLIQLTAGNDDWYVVVTLVVLLLLACQVLTWVWVWTVNREVKLLWKAHSGRPTLKDVWRDSNK